MTCIVATVGTSLFTNYNLVSASIEIRYEATKKALHQEWDDRQESIQSIRNNSDFTLWISGHLKESCAEIASLMKIVETEQDDVDVRLLATDTVLSRLAAEIIKEQTISHPAGDKTVSLKFDPAKDVIEGFRVDDAEVFETVGLQNFIRRFVALTKQHSALILNITGGYKGLIPYLTMIGQINHVPVKYKFEESDALITIPQLPINFDWELAVEYGDQVSGDLKKLNADKKRYLVEKKILDCNAKLTPLGRILKIYAETVDLKDEVERQLRGYCAEFRWFEYYVSKYPGLTVRRSVGKEQLIAGKTISKEADIVIEGDGRIIIAESKPRSYIYSYLDNSDTQIDNLLQELKNNNLDIHEYHLCVYSTGNDRVSVFSKHPAICSIRAVVHNHYPECIFILFLMCNVRELPGFMHKPLSSINAQIEIQTIPYP